MNPDEIPTVGITEADWIFTPNDSDLYAELSGKTAITVTKAAKAPNMPESTMTTTHSTAKVGDVALPEGWSWQDTDQDKALADETPVTATAVYTGADKGNYEKESVTISIIRSACEHKHTKIRNQKDAACNEKGYTGDTYCTECNALLSAGNETAELGHDYKAEITRQPTTTEEGVRTYICSRCHDTYTENIAKLTTSVTPSPTPGNSEMPSLTPKPNGTKIQDDEDSTYMVTNEKGKTPTVQYVAPKKAAKGIVIIPATVTIDNVTYKVTSIAHDAFKNNKKITEVVIGSNIVSIGKNAFIGCKRLKTITIKSNKLTSKSIKKGAFNGISKKTVIKVPKKKYKAYKKLFRTKGLSKKVKLKRY